MSSHTRGEGREPALDGLRGLAALGVFLGHARVLDSGAGAAGVYCFFMLSGYLLFPRFEALVAGDRARLPTVARGLVIYLWRRIWRMVPAYLIAMLIYRWQLPDLMEPVVGALDWRDFLVVKVWFHFWTVKEELILYLLLPPLALLLILARGGWRLPVALLIGAALCQQTEINYLWIDTAPGQGWHLYAVPFFIGMVIAWYPIVANPRRAVALVVIGLVGIGFLIAKGGSVALGVDYGRLNYLLYPPCAALLIGAASAPRMAILSTPPARSIGVIGYGFYLYHALFIFKFHGAIVNHEPGGIALVFLLTLIAGTLSHILVERPAMTIARWRWNGRLYTG